MEIAVLYKGKITGFCLKGNAMLLWLLFLLLFAKAFSQKPASLPPSVQWKHGEQTVYSVFFSMNVKTNFAAIGISQADTTLGGSIRGLMAMTCSKILDQRFLIFCSFQKNVSVQLPLLNDQNKEVQKILEQGFYLLQHQSGRIDSIFWNGKASDAAVQIILQIVEVYQVPFSEKEAAFWETDLFLADGHVEAAYQQTTKGKETAQIQLVSLEENRAFQMPSILNRHTQYSSTLNYSVSTNNHRIRQLKGTLVRKSKMNHKTITELTGVYEYQCIKTSKKRIGKTGEDFEAGSLIRIPLFHPTKLVEVQKERDRQKAASFSMAALVRLLQKSKQTMDEQQIEGLTDLLRVAFSTQKDSLDLVAAVFIKENVQSPAFKIIRAAAVAAATPAAQQMLIGYIQSYRKQEASRLGFILSSASLVANPSTELLHEVFSVSMDTALSESIRSSSQLAVGNLLYNWKHTREADAEKMLGQLLLTMKDRDDDLLYLAVIGNSGINAAFEKVLPFLTDSSETERAMAYYSLRFMDGANIDTILSNGLHVETNEEVVMNIVNAFKFRPYSNVSLDPVIQMALKNQSPQMAVAAFELIIQWSYTRGSLLDTIRIIKQKSIHESVRVMAEDVLRDSEL